MEPSSTDKKVFLFLAGVSSLLEYYTTFQDDLNGGQKYTIKKCVEPLRNVENKFKRQGLIDHADYDMIVSILVESLCNLEEEVIEK